jgi:pyruvate formate lyase activating enzyme
MIHSIDTMGLVDGPGIRVVVFMQGCPLRCQFCHNPDTWNKNGKIYTPQQLLDFILRYKDYFKNNGGVTFSGGEPLMQSEFLLETLKLCKENHIHTCLDTSGYGDNYEELLDYVDLILYDIKALDKDKYKNLTGQDINKTLEFLNVAQKKHKKLWIRQVIIPGFNDNIEYITELKEFISKIENVEKVELLPYHTMGVTKYEELNIPYKLKGVPDMDTSKCKQLEDYLIS